MLSSDYRGRFAPSPTGPLHFGSLLSAVASYAQARSRQGEWVIRMEDLDRPREVAGMADTIIAQLAAFGMTSDQPIIYQSTRSPAYGRALATLQRHGRVFDCGCTRSELKGMQVYPGTCRDGLPAGRLARSLRVQVEPQTIGFDDCVQGRFEQQLVAEAGDFVVRRADGLFAYQLAVVVDDAEQGITEVVRGCDLLDSTPRQIYLQRLLGCRQPGYLHVPLAVDADGAKLSKSWAAAPVDPSQPLDGLIAAWQFLGQSPLAAVTSLRSFWLSAVDCWDVDAIPRRHKIQPELAGR